MTAATLRNLAYMVMAQNRPAEAEPLLREALEIEQSARPPGHPYISDTMYTLAVAIKAQDRFTEAEALFRKRWLYARNNWHERRLYTFDSLGPLADLLEHTNQPNEAAKIRRICPSYQARFPGDAWKAVRHLTFPSTTPVSLNFALSKGV